MGSDERSLKHRWLLEHCGRNSSTLFSYRQARLENPTLTTGSPVHLRTLNPISSVNNSNSSWHLPWIWPGLINKVQRTENCSLLRYMSLFSLSVKLGCWHINSEWLPNPLSCFMLRIPVILFHSMRISILCQWKVESFSFSWRSVMPQKCSREMKSGDRDKPGICFTSIEGKQFSQHLVHCHSEQTSAIRTGMLEQRILLIVMLCLRFPLNDWADIAHSCKKQSHLLSIYTCMAEAGSLFTWPDRTGVQRTRLARGKYQGKLNKNRESKMEITQLCNTWNPLCTFSACLYWCLCLVFSQKVLKYPYDLCKRIYCSYFLLYIILLFWVCLSNLKRKKTMMLSKTLHRSILPWIQKVQSHNPPSNPTIYLDYMKLSEGAENVKTQTVLGKMLSYYQGQKFQVHTYCLLFSIFSSI